MKVCIHTFGCQMNKLDSELVAEALTKVGHTIVADEDEAEVILFNTCSVRDHAEQRVLSRVEQLKARKNREPALLLGIMGCFAQRLQGELFERLPHLDLVCGTRQFPHIAALLEQAQSGHTVAVEEETLTAPGAKTPHDRTLFDGIQGYVSVMRGCNNFCSYCIVPYVRGREESRPTAAIVQEAKALADKGAKELILLGQNVDTYGKDIGTDLADLLHAVHDIEGLKRIRFVTSHPRDINEKLVRSIAELPKVCEHLHMPAQSGSTPVLKAMRRGYTREEYDERLALVNECAPGTLVTSDFIVGFPGETDEDFEKTLDLVGKAKFQNAYVFKYSPRPGTLASRTMEDSVPDEVKKSRNYRMLEAQEKVNVERNESLVGSTQEIMVEGLSRRDKSRMIGRTATNLICVFDAPEDCEKLVGEIVKVKVDTFSPLTLYTSMV